MKNYSLIIWPVPLLAIVLLLVVFGMARAQQDPGKPLVVGSEEDYPPFAIGKTDETASGFTVDLWKVVARESGLNYTIRSAFPADSRRVQSREDRRDDQLAQSEERRCSRILSSPRHRERRGFVRRASRASGRKRTAGKSIIVVHRIGVICGCQRLEAATGAVNTAADGLKLLASGQHDAMLLSKLAGMQTC